MDAETEPGPRRDIAETTGRITPSEKRVLLQMATGRTFREIAEVLHLSPHTVRTHQKTIYRKLGVHRRSEALILARKLHII